MQMSFFIDAEDFSWFPEQVRQYHFSGFKKKASRMGPTEITSFIHCYLSFDMENGCYLKRNGDAIASFVCAISRCILFIPAIQRIRRRMIIGL